MIVKRFCPHCKIPIGDDGNYIDLGNPLGVCGLCKRQFIRAHVTEWQLKSIWSKTYYTFIMLYTSIFWGSIPFGVTQYFWKDIELAVIIYIISVLCLAILLLCRLTKDVAESNRRIEDPIYRERLRQAGLLR